MSRIGFLERDAWMTLGTSVVFSKLSKLLNQEDALGAPCLQRFRDYSGATKLARCGFRFGLHQLEALLRVDVCSPLARPRGARECREQV
jgi:hypothetical protein